MFTFVLGAASAVLVQRLWKPLMKFYLRKETEIKKTLEGDEE